MAAEDKVHESIRILIDFESSRSNHSNQSNVTICMVPDALRNLNPSAYTPRITSIGPLHKEDQRLKAMDEYKVTFMYRLFRQTVEATAMDMEQITRKCAQEVLALVTQARACYAPSFTNYDDFKFAEMMVIDGCFILELLCRSQYGIGEGAPIFDNILVKRDIKNDLLLLENQIPFFILKTLFRLTVQRIENNVSLTDHVIHFFMDMNIIYLGMLTITDGTMEPCHILGFIQSCYRPSATNRERIFGHLFMQGYSATELACAGVKFKKKGNQNSLLDVNFNESCLEIPVLCITNSTTSLLRNLIAYEQCYPFSHHYVTSFVFFMNRLLDTKDDVLLLVKSRVLQYNLGATEEDVTNLFNSICSIVIRRDFYYREEWIQLYDYCHLFWPVILISLSRLYKSVMIELSGLFKSTTWKTLTVISAVMIFILTLVQTIYTVQKP